MRWWDGKAWTEDVRESTEGGLPGLAVAGFAVGALLPVVGVVIAVVLLARSQVGPGLAVLVWSILAAGVFLALMA